MTSILTNVAAMSALATLRGIDSSMEDTQSRISSGYRVGSAADNSAYWSIATTMRSDNAALSTVQDALGLSSAKADTATAGLDQTIKILDLIKSKLTGARDVPDKEKINRELIELKSQLVSVITASSFSSENWLYNTSTAAPAVKNMVGAFTRTDANTIAIQSISFDTARSCLLDKSNANRAQLSRGMTVSQATGTTTTTMTYFLVNISSTTAVTSGTEIVLTSTTTGEAIDAMAQALDNIITGVVDAQATLGAVTTRLDTQKTFVKTLSDTITKGVGRLVDADMNEESTKLKALQTQQQLTIQSLTIANTSAQSIMQLFR